MRRLKIAFLSRDLPSRHPNGVSVQVHALANELTRRGHAVSVFSMDEKPEDALYRTVVCAAGPKTRWTRLFAPARFFAGADYSPFDLIHAHGDNYLLRAEKPVVRTFYGSALWEALHDDRFIYRTRQALFYPLERLCARRSSVCVGISKNTSRVLGRISEIIPCSVDLEFFRPAAQKSPAPSVLFVGNLSGRKRGRLVVEAFLREVAPRFPQARLHVVTGEKFVASPCIQIYPHASNEELLHLYQGAWILCMASSYEGFGVPIIEAFACKTTVISTENAGSREIISHLEDGVLCGSGEIGIWMKRLLEDTPLRERLGQRGLEKSQGFCLKGVAEKYESVYERLLPK